MKYLITFALIYFAYRYFFESPAALEDQGQATDSPHIKHTKRDSAHDDEYVDYEEVE